MPLLRSAILTIVRALKLVKAKGNLVQHTAAQGA
jgi:hypothetical protein